MHRQDKADKVEALLFAEACCATVNDSLAKGHLLWILGQANRANWYVHLDVIASFNVGGWTCKQNPPYA